MNTLSRKHVKSWNFVIVLELSNLNIWCNLDLRRLILEALLRNPRWRHGYSPNINITILHLNDLCEPCRILESFYQRTFGVGKKPFFWKACRINYFTPFEYRDCPKSYCIPPWYEHRWLSSLFFFDVNHLNPSLDSWKLCIKFYQLLANFCWS